VSTLSVFSPHIRRRHKLAKRVVEGNWGKTWNRDVYDPRGNFAIINNKLIHYTLDGIHKEVVADKRLFIKRSGKR